MKYLQTLKKIHKMLLSVCLTLLIALPAQAQVKIGGRVMDRVERKVETRVLRKVDEAVDKVLDKAEESAEESAKRKREEKEAAEKDGPESTNGTEVENVIVKVEEDDSTYEPVSNDFIGTFTMRTELYKKGKMDKDSPSRITYTFDTWQTGFRVATPSSEQAAEMIIDLKENTITTKVNSNGSLQAMRMKRPRIKTTLESVHEEKDIQITETNERETINGYPCVKYLVSTPEEESEIWITQAVGFNYNNIARTMNMSVGTRNKASTQGTNIYGMDGVPMRTLTTQKNGEVIKTEIERFEEGRVDQSILSLDGYELMSIPGFGG